MMRMPNPLMEALDADKDGVLSAEEIEGAVAALKSLDKNEDGRLDGEEVRPRGMGMPPGMRDWFPGGGFPGGGFPGGGFPGGDRPDGGAPAEADAGAMVERMLQMDKDGDGKLSKGELPDRLQSVLARGDKNEDGQLDKDEISAIARERSGGGRPGEPGVEGGGPGGPGGRGGDFVGQMMNRMDADKDGKLTGDEVPEFLRGRLTEIDTNGDGGLDKAEMEAMASRMRERGGAGGGGPGGPGGFRGGRRGDRPPLEDGADRPKGESGKSESGAGQP
jgi:Ca2+-binding EF-hand superfamily protein